MVGMAVVLIGRVHCRWSRTPLHRWQEQRVLKCSRCRTRRSYGNRYRRDGRYSIRQIDLENLTASKSLHPPPHPGQLLRSLPLPRTCRREVWWSLNRIFNCCARLEYKVPFDKLRAGSRLRRFVRSSRIGCARDDSRRETAAIVGQLQGQESSQPKPTAVRPRCINQTIGGSCHAKELDYRYQTRGPTSRGFRASGTLLSSGGQTPGPPSHWRDPIPGRSDR